MADLTPSDGLATLRAYVVNTDNATTRTPPLHARAGLRRSLGRERLVVAGRRPCRAAVLRRRRSLRGRSAPRNRHRRDDLGGDPGTGRRHGGFCRHRADARSDDHDRDRGRLCRDPDTRWCGSCGERCRRRGGRHGGHGRPKRGRRISAPVRPSRRPGRDRRPRLRRSALASAPARGARVSARAGGACSGALAASSAWRRPGVRAGSAAPDAHARLGSVDTHGGCTTDSPRRAAPRRPDRTCGSHGDDPCSLPHDRPRARHTGGPHAWSSRSGARLARSPCNDCTHDSGAERRRVLRCRPPSRGGAAGDSALDESVGGGRCFERSGRKCSVAGEWTRGAHVTRLALRACSGGSRAGATRRAAAARGASTPPARSRRRRCLRGSRGSGRTGGPP